MRCAYCFKEIKIADLCPYCGSILTDTPHNEDGQLQPGTMLMNRYQIGKSLGQGGFGVTYLAYSRYFEKRCAIKEYYPQQFVVRRGNAVMPISAENRNVLQEGLAGFLQEARILNGFSNDPNLVFVTDFFEENGTAYYVMDYYAGDSLEEVIESSGGSLSIDKTQELLKPIFAALETIHEKGILHRDVAPNNILITGKNQARLIDFGAARLDFRQTSNSKAIVAKPGFTPPEQYSQKNNQGPWTDVYALSATIYRALTGVIPENSLDRMLAGHEQLRSPQELGVKLSDGENRAIMKALSLKPEKRFRSVEDFQNAFYASSLPCEKPKRNVSSGGHDAQLEKTEEKDLDEPLTPLENRDPEKENKLPLGSQIALAAILTLWLLFIPDVPRVIPILLMCIVWFVIFMIQENNQKTQTSQIQTERQDTSTQDKPVLQQQAADSQGRSDQFTSHESIAIGAGNPYQKLSDILKVLKNMRGDVELYVEGTTDEGGYSFSLGMNSNIRSLTISAADADACVRHMPFLFADGVPLTIGEGLRMPETDIFGGAIAVDGITQSVSRSSLTISGRVRNVFGGGYAYGKNSSSNVTNASITLNGQAENLFAGGSAHKGGEAALSGEAHVLINEKARVLHNLYSGGSASSSGSKTLTNSVSLRVLGEVDGQMLDGGFSDDESSESMMGKRSRFIFD